MGVAPTAPTPAPPDVGFWGAPQGEVQGWSQQPFQGWSQEVPAETTEQPGFGDWARSMLLSGEAALEAAACPGCGEIGCTDCEEDDCSKCEPGSCGDEEEVADADEAELDEFAAQADEFEQMEELRLQSLEEAAQQLEELAEARQEELQQLEESHREALEALLEQQAEEQEAQQSEEQEADVDVDEDDGDEVEEVEELEVSEPQPLRALWPAGRFDVSGFPSDPQLGKRVDFQRSVPNAGQPAPEEALTGEVTGLVNELCAEVVSLREMLRALREEIHRGGFEEQL
jgi:chemotaxis protein histidine kinase CheA